MSWNSCAGDSIRTCFFGIDGVVKALGDGGTVDLRRVSAPGWIGSAYFACFMTFSARQFDRD
jgi:hypothetical protein